MKDWIELLRTGTHTASSGAKVTIDGGFLRRVAANYDVAHHEAPAVLGHPKDNAPAYGWTEALKVEGDKLLAKVRPVESLREWVRDGLYRKVSASIYPDLGGKGPYLRHIGFLGAQPPAIKGLAPAQFEDDGAVCLEFATERSDGMDWEKLQQMFHDFAEKINAGVSKALGRTEGAPTGGGGDVKAQIADAVKAATDDLTRNFTEQVGELKKEMGEQAKQLTAAEETARRAGIRNFADKMKADGKWVPAFETMHLVEFMESLPADGVIEFSETTEKDGKTETVTTKQSPLQFFQSFLEKLPKIVEFGELTGGVKGGQSSSKVIDFTPGDRRATNIDLAERASAIADEKKIEYGEALEMARRESA